MFDALSGNYPCVSVCEFDIRERSKSTDKLDPTASMEVEIVDKKTDDKSKRMSQDDYQKIIDQSYGRRNMSATISTWDGDFGAVQITAGPSGRYKNKNEDRIRYAELSVDVAHAFHGLNEAERTEVLSQTFHRINRDLKTEGIGEKEGCTLSE